MRKIILLLLSLTLFSCASAPKKKTAETLEVSLGTEGFASVFFNIIAITDEESTKFVVNGVMGYESPSGNQIVLEKEKPLSLNIDGQIVELKPIKDKYVYNPQKVSSGARVLHLQSNDYKLPMKVLKQITNAKIVVVKIPAAPHKNGGFDGVLRKDGFKRIKKFSKKF